MYEWTADPTREPGGRALIHEAQLERLDDSGPGVDRLWGRFVRVRNAAVVLERGPQPGETSAVPVGDARPDAQGNFLFDPARGGARVDKHRPRSEKYLRRYVEAARFGEVNTYFHVDRIAAHVDALLQELGARSLPRVVAVVNAHHAAITLPDRTRDGVLRSGRWVPFQGGHYRLPNRRYSVVEFDPISADGEIHLGPGWKLLEHGALVEAAGARYRHMASHNAGTIYHEYGHHVARHTADFRANALRPADRQSNIKTALDEGFADYWAATMLDTPHIWAWHRRHDDDEIHDRSLVSPTTMSEFVDGAHADPHVNGTIWATALWELRDRMRRARADGVRECDKLVLEALRLVGREGGDPRETTVRQIRLARASFPAAVDALIRADERLHDGAFRDAIVDSFARRGIRRESRHGAASAAVAPAGLRSEGADRRRTRRARDHVQLDSGWEENAATSAAVEEARTRLLRHVPAEDVPPTRDLFARGELAARLRELGEPPLSLLVTGDTMLGGRSTRTIVRRGLHYPFKALRPLLRRSSIVLGNLEGPIAAKSRRQERNYSYRVNPRMATVLKRAGFHVMTLANNHLLDCGRRGVLETLDALRAARIEPLGAGTCEQAAHAPVIREASGLRIGLLGYYWNRRTAARESLPGSAMDPPEALADDIGRLRKSVDRVVVTFHWGVPYVREPSPEDRAKARFAVDCGADAVIGHHVHVIQPFEIHRDRPIFYGIGNGAFGSGNSKGEGLLVGLTFEPNRTRLYVYALYVKNRDPRVDHQPKVLRGETARHYFTRLRELSGDHGPRLHVDDFRCTLELPWSQAGSDVDAGQFERERPS